MKKENIKISTIHFHTNNENKKNGFQQLQDCMAA